MVLPLPGNRWQSGNIFNLVEFFGLVFWFSFLVKYLMGLSPPIACRPTSCCHSEEAFGAGYSRRRLFSFTF